ncbi:MAG TPA: ROK family transcriptional regulator [Acidobacteriaceae bacterium]|nr:ROK family transcriptional regulator [Acidobacteriaceae bacterium]
MTKSSTTGRNKTTRQNGSKQPAAHELTHALRRADLAYVRLASSEVARDINRDVILELVRAKQPVARMELARASGLYPSTVSSIVEELIDEGWVVEGGTQRLPRGRRPTLLSLNEDIVMLAVDVRPEQATIAVVDLNSRLLSQKSIVLPSNVERALPELIAALERMREMHPSKSFEGIGLSMPGRVDPVTQKLVLAPNLRWAGYEIAGEIEAALGLKVEMENEANACLIAEVWSGRLDGVRDAVLVAISEGIGTAVLSNGQMISGWGGLAGEFGHIVMDPAGPKCGCGRTGCWEMFGSTRAAVRFYHEARGGSEPGMAGAITGSRLLNLAADEDRAAMEALNRQAEYLGRGLHAITAALSPEVVLFTGELTSAWHRFGPVVEAELRKQMLAGPPPRVMTTLNPEFARLRGAAALVLQRHSGYHRTHMHSGRDRTQAVGESAGLAS